MQAYLTIVVPMSGFTPSQGGGAQLPSTPSMGRPIDPGYGVSSPIDPSYGVSGPPAHAGNWVPGSWEGHPSQGLPQGPGHASQGLPWAPVHPSQGLPWAPAHAGNYVPGSWAGRPDQSLPGGPGHVGNRPPHSGSGNRPSYPIVIPPGSVLIPSNPIYIESGDPNNPIVIPPGTPLVPMQPIYIAPPPPTTPDQGLPPESSTKPVEPTEPSAAPKK